jgi:hypothetical protein
MKKFSILCLVAVFASCNSTEPKVDSITATGDTTTTADVSFPYSVSYSSKFEMGDAKHSQTIMALWKAWDNADFATMKEHFADSVEMRFANGWIDKGPRDTVLAHAQQFRGSMDSVTSFVTSVIALKSTDKNQNWVTVWGKEITKDKKGMIDSIGLQEAWRINKDGKIDFMLQYHQKLAPPKM